MKDMKASADKLRAEAQYAEQIAAFNARGRN